MEIAVIILVVLSNMIGFNDGIEYQKYYDKLMREKVVHKVYNDGYADGIRKTELDKQIKMLELGIEYMEE